MNIEKQLMWEYQMPFWGAAQASAKAIFKKLDKKLNPLIVLVGILVSDDKKRHAINAEVGYTSIDIEVFSDLQPKAHKEFKKIMEQSKLTGNKRQDAYDVFKILLGKAIQEKLNQYDEQTGSVSFSTVPLLVNGYMISTILQFSKDVFNSNYSLKRRSHRGFPTAKSLIDAIIPLYLDGCQQELRQLKPGASLFIFSQDFDEIIRSGGKILMNTVALAAGKPGLESVFHTCNTISSMRYEGRESIGRIFISDPKHPNIKMTLSLSAPIRINDYRTLRKLLETTSGKIGLVCDSEKIYGLGQISGSYDKRREDLFTISFTKYNTWELSHAKSAMMHVIFGQPQLPKMPIDKKDFKKSVRWIFPNIKHNNFEKLWQLIQVATRQKRGTMVVVTTETNKEALRLENQAIRVEPFYLKPKQMEMITKIDGAVLLSPGTRCYAIGVILDGTASDKTTSARGSRYNSAMNYVEGKKGRLTIVVSEDGLIDLLPKLKTNSS